MKKKIIEKILTLVQRKYPFVKNLKSLKTEYNYASWSVLVDKDKYLDYFNATEDMLDTDLVVGYVDRFLQMKYWDNDLQNLGDEIDKYIGGVIKIIIGSHPKIKNLGFESIGSYYMDKKQNQMEHNLSKIIKRVIKESELTHYARRIQELRDLINNQVEMQDPCNFDDGDEYADFCISTGMGWFFGFDPWSDTDYSDEDDDDEEVRPTNPDISIDDYNKINTEMTNEFYDDLVALWDEYSEEC
jgi:hypothetical protein